MNSIEKEYQQATEESHLTGENALYLEALLKEDISDNHVLEHDQADIIGLINSYRAYGHLAANLDPLELATRKNIPQLDLSYYQLSLRDECIFHDTKLNVAALYEKLQEIYTKNIGFEFMHISDHAEINWLQKHIEANHYEFSDEDKKSILHDLVSANSLEKYLGNKYVGQKRFSLEGGESLIPVLNSLVKHSGYATVKELVIGMAHRGRLNVLVNVLGKSPAKLFDEFAGKHAVEITGDVKYHLGFSSDVQTKAGNQIHLSLAFNPSHLEIIGPVVQGSVRARQKRRDDLLNKDQVIPIIIHGDAAIAGQGVVMEMMNFSQARGYSTGGTIHIIINNQIGFTTSNPLDSRSTLYSSDIAKVIQAPIFHVNGDDPEALLFATEIAFNYRMRFKKDVVIDIVSYRKHGHNEADDPTITQPVMYNTIKQHDSVLIKYTKELEAKGIIQSDTVTNMQEAYYDALDNDLPVVQTIEASKISQQWGDFLDKDWQHAYISNVPVTKLDLIWKVLSDKPPGFTEHRLVTKLRKDYTAMMAGTQPINWGFAEQMAYGTLLAEDYGVRISGQDSVRGTFAHRHATYYDANTGAAFCPLQSISKKFAIIDSVLSEEAVLAFEYGFALTDPDTLTIWEAQFGDFANGAQVVIDQFISSGEQKWGRLCGLVMLLPHGFEGQGPEHSSARLERFLQLSAQDNIQVCVPRNPSQIFHLLRRQVLRPYRKPLIVMTPKSLLRHPLATSSINDLTEGKFLLAIPDDLKITPAINKLILCTGKIYYELIEARQKENIQTTAIITIEQLYPFPESTILEILKQYHQVNTVIWCQEEPKNQGAWFVMQENISKILLPNQQLSYVGRPSWAAPAEGSAKDHTENQQAIIKNALKEM